MAGGEGEYVQKRMDAIKLAKGSKWEELKKLVDAEPLTAQQVDSYGMLPLHWACTEPHSISEGVLMSLLKAYPHGARATNTAEMLPLQIAIKAQAKIEWLQALLASYPDAVLKKTPSGETAVQLARKTNLPSRSVKLLEEMYHHVCEKAGYADQLAYDDQQAAAATATAVDADDTNGHVSGQPLQKRYNADGPYSASVSSIPSTRESGGSVKKNSRSYKSRAYSENDFQTMNVDALRSTASSSNMSAGSMTLPAPVQKPLPYQTSTRMTTRTVVSLPPRWMNAPNCHICSQRFSPFKKRHHCRNCGQSICRDHSARERVKLPHYGLSDRHRVCTVCHDLLRNADRLMLQPNQSGRMTTQSQLVVPARRSDEALRSPAQAPPAYQLERHVSAPARQNNADVPYQGIHDQVVSLQKQVSQLMEEKEIAQSQLRAQAELLEEALDPERLTLLSNRDSGRDRVHSVPMKLPTTAPGSNTSGTSPESAMHLVNQAGRGMHRPNSGYDGFKGRNVDADTQGMRVGSPVQSSQTVPSSSTATRLQNDMANLSVTDSPYDIVSEFEDRPTDLGEFDDSDAIAVEEDDDDDDDENMPEVDVLVNLGHLMMEKGSANAAVQAFARAVDICPNDPVLYSYLGRAYYADENLDDAVIAITKSLELEPSATNSTLLGKILFEKGDHEKAIEAYQKSLAI